MQVALNDAEPDQPIGTGQRVQMFWSGSNAVVLVPDVCEVAFSLVFSYKRLIPIVL